MPKRWENTLQRWLNAGLLDAAVADRIRAYESEQERALGIRWPVLLAWSLGGLLLAAGVLLFVAAHWDEISPAARFTIVLLMVAVFHLGGAVVAQRSELLATVLHAVGTVTLGAAIFLTGQIFNLQEHWPGGLMLWAAGAWLAWGVRRDWVQVFFAALLTPAWLASEWLVATEGLRGSERVLGEGLLLLSFTYLSAVLPEKRDYLRRALSYLGAAGVLPFVFLWVIASAQPWWWRTWGAALEVGSLAWVIGWAVALGAPLAVAYWLRGNAAWLNLAAAVWVIVLGALNAGDDNQLLIICLWCALGSMGVALWGVFEEHQERVLVGFLGLLVSYCFLLAWAHEHHKLLIYLLCAAGAVGVVAWGVRAERLEGINVGVACFALTVAFFYFSTVMDKLGRAASLIGLGVLFLVGGWLLERTRRKLVAGIDRGAQ
jgi:uncharacterized membrane protein